MVDSDLGPPVWNGGDVEEERPGSGGEETGRGTETVDACVEFSMDDERLSVCAASIRAETGGGRPLGGELIRELLAAEGIVHGILEEEIARLLERFQSEGECDRRIVIARGDPCVAAGPGRVEFVAGGASAAVFPGEVFARWIPGEAGRPGRTVTGELIPAPEPPAGLEVGPKGHCRLDDNAGVQTAVALAYGEPRLEGRQIWVEPGVRVSEDAYVCRLDVFPVRIDGSPVNEADLLRALEAAGIARDLLDDEALRQVCAEAIRTGGVVENRVVARGIQPVPGRDGGIEFTVDIEERVGTLDDRGRIDFKDQNRLHQVGKDQVIARLIHHTPGRPGRTVTGQKVVPVPGRPLRIRWGKGVREEDGVLYAEFGGVLVIEGASIQVSSGFRIAGDVDYHTGNISNLFGGIVVEGSVLAGFKLFAGGDIEIGKSIEGGTVEAAGRLIVRDAIVGSEGSVVSSGRDLCASRILNARIDCGGDLSVEGEAIQCGLRVAGMLRVRGRPGAIVGGEIEADGGVVTEILGSSQGVPTLIRVGSGTRRLNELRAALKANRDPLLQIGTRFGDGSAADTLSRLHRLIAAAEFEEQESPTAAAASRLRELIEKRASIRKLLRLQSELELACAELEEEIETLESQRRSLAGGGLSPRVEIRGTVYPGVVLVMGGVTYRVERTYTAVRFFYNASRERVEARRSF